MEVGYLLDRVESRLQTLKPDQDALALETGETWTYGKLNETTNRYANALLDKGVRKGDRVGILLFNSLEYFAVYFAVAKIGGIAVRINFRLETEELAYILNDSGSKVLCFDASLAERLEPIRGCTPVETFICYDRNADKVPDWAESWEVLGEGDKMLDRRPEIEETDPVMLMYTSGTTGRPKGALWTHRNTIWFAAMQSLKWNFDGNTVGMTTGPLYHVGAMEDVALAVLLSGGTVVISRSGNFEIRRTLEVIKEKQVSDIFLFPFMIYEMLKLSDIESYRLDSLQRIYSGGDPIISWAIDRLHELFPHIGLIQVYGLTEGTPIAVSLDPSDAATKGYTAGKPMPFTEVKVVDDEGRTLSAGKIGEICTKGPAVVSEYWNKAEANAKTFVDGWCHTGDLGVIDAEGYLTISGRKKDMIRSGGENIYPVEVEDVLIRHDAVQDVAVIGIPDPKFIETVCAVIVKKPGRSVSEKELLEFAGGKLARYKKPRSFVFLDELPRTASGKVQKFRLRDQYKHLHEPQVNS
ncbi:Acyl-CoA synthetase (AMP-forming)/AMP-acid ligase II [Bhargavaea beijingensis]|uniref:Acyl-CoA synthetase (AMP-forming)/AMP-acid ligase II n=1 Tax=Bhargavaea beijingensis TaxID=426756 RepID=A0A1G7FKJ9_9BACL|nr:long-chain-fatty-acid--CoA ligase [Bhargavaea beijingensis]SDE76370.1 Acyl-CoA synthetase (AMP-forming)/AMP-acid ligase II [Bhargavaea beijingensis]